MPRATRDAHHIAHQLAPLADAILRFLGTDFASVAPTRKQLSLLCAAVPAADCGCGAAS